MKRTKSIKTSGGSAASTVKSLIPAEVVEKRIYVIRGQKVMIDRDLAELYRISTSQLNKAVKRNLARFPDDFMFQLTSGEGDSLRFQIGISKTGRGGRRYAPYAFTEHGVAMLSSVLNSPRAVQLNIFIVRVFVKLREVLSTHRELAEKVDGIERAQLKQGNLVATLYEVVKQLMAAPTPKKRPFGFLAATAEKPTKPARKAAAAKA